MCLATRAGRRRSPVVGYRSSAGARCWRRSFGRRREPGGDGSLSAIHHRWPGRQGPEARRRARSASVGAPGRLHPMCLATRAGRRRSPVVGYRSSAGARCWCRSFGQQREPGTAGPVSAIRHRWSGRQAPDGRRRGRAASVGRPGGFAPCAWPQERAGRSLVVGYLSSTGASCWCRSFGRRREPGGDGPVSAIRHRWSGRQAPKARRRGCDSPRTSPTTSLATANREPAY